MDDLKPGIYPGVPFDEYLKWEAVSNTLLVKLRKQSPMPAKYFMDPPKPSTPAQTIGHDKQRAVSEEAQIGGIFPEDAEGIFVVLFSAAGIGLCCDVDSHRSGP